jgi:hypothetical protein
VLRSRGFAVVDSIDSRLEQQPIALASRLADDTSPSHRLSAAQSLLTSCVGIGAVNASMVLWSAHGPWSVRVPLAAFDVAQRLAIGIAGYWVLTLLRRRGSMALPALVALFAWVGGAWIAPDFASFTDRHNHPELRIPLGIAAALSVPLAAIAGRACRWAPLRVAALAAALLATIVNHSILQADYPGIHLLLACNAVALAAGALTSARLPRRLLPPLAWLSQRHRGAWASAVVLPLSALSVVILPPTPVLVEAFRSEGSVLFPFVVPLHGDQDGDQSAAVASPYLGDQNLAIAAQYLNPRDGLPELAPSQPVISPPQPIIIFITIDAMRAELLARDEWRRRLPSLAGLADEAVEFTQARSPGSTTRNSLGQVFSSRYASQLRWGKSGRFNHLRDDPTPRLTDRLRERGFTTLHVVPIATLASEHAVVGRFDHERFLKSPRKGQRFALSGSMVKEAQKLVKEHAVGPTFLYMHWLDAHDPYDAAGTEGSTFERYLREVELADRSLGKLIEGLRASRLWDRAVVIISADHGEALGDHGIPHHGGSIYESLVRVPLLIRVPGVRPRRVDAPVTTLDIAPTLLDLLGHTTPGSYMGQSLVGFLRGEAPRLERPIGIDEGRLRIYGLVMGEYKVIDHRRRRTVEVYDLRRDPGELTNLYGSFPDGRDEKLLSLLRLLFVPLTQSAPQGAEL